MAIRQKISVVFVQPIVSPTRVPWLKMLDLHPNIDLTVIALTETLAHRPGWSTKDSDATGLRVEILDSRIIRSKRRFSGSDQSDTGHRILAGKLTRRLLQLAPGIIIVTNATELLQALPARLFLHARIILAAEDTRLIFSRLPRLLRRFKRLVYKQADAFCAHSSETRSLLLELGIDRNRIAFTPWAVDNELFSREVHAAKGTQIRSRIGAKGNIALTVGSLIPRKGVEHLLHAWQMLSDETRSNSTLLIVGDGQEHERLNGFCRENGLDEVHFFGHLTHEEVAECFAAADLFVLPTLEDIWGLVASEAMAAGLPILCSVYAGCAGDLVINESNGYIFDPLDHKNLASLLDIMLSDRKILSDMGARSKQIITEFTIERSVAAMAGAIIQTYTSQDH